MTRLVPHQSCRGAGRRRETAIAWATAVTLTLTVAAGVFHTCRGMLFWPTDAFAYYLPGAWRWHRSSFLSEIHEEVDDTRRLWLHGKEIMIAAVALVQRATGDYAGTTPFLIVNCAAAVGAAVLIFWLGARWWGPWIGLSVFGLSLFSVWPWLYVLMLRHQVLGLMFFLAGVSCLPDGTTPWLERMRRGSLFGLSGVFMGLSLMSSTVSAAYGPLWAAALLLSLRRCRERRTAVRYLCLACLAAAAVLIATTLPRPWEAWRQWWRYLQITKKHNHFFYNQPFLQQWFPDEEVAGIRGGLSWVMRYLFAVDPWLVAPAVGGLILIVLRTLSRRDVSAWALILLLSSPLFLIEAMRVAQYGANYFPLFPALLVFFGWGVHLAVTGANRCRPFVRHAAVFVVLVLTVIHGLVNAAVFQNDVLPARLGPTRLVRFLETTTGPLYVHRTNPHTPIFLRTWPMSLLNRVVLIDRLFDASMGADPRTGWLVVMPVTGDSLYRAAHATYVHFDRDSLLSALMVNGRLAHLPGRSFPTVNNSRLWLLEEEVFAYLSLMGRHDFKDNDSWGRVYAVPARRLRPHMRGLLWPSHYADDVSRSLRRIGWEPRLLIFLGAVFKVPRPVSLRGIAVRLQKRGSPDDTLVAYVYQPEPVQGVWVPAGKSFRSRPLVLKKDAADGTIEERFIFDPPLVLKPGWVRVQIYRSGPRSSRDYYAIDPRRFTALAVPRRGAEGGGMTRHRNVTVK